MLFGFTGFIRQSVVVFLAFGRPFPPFSHVFSPSSLYYMPPFSTSTWFASFRRCPIYITPFLETVTLEMEIDAVIIHVQYIELNFVQQAS